MTTSEDELEHIPNDLECILNGIPKTLKRELNISWMCLNIHWILSLTRRMQKCKIALLRRPHGPLTRYVKLRVAHSPEMLGTFSPPPHISDPDMHRGTCVTHVPWCMSGSRTSGFIWIRWQVKRSRQSRRMRYPQFYVSGKRLIPNYFVCILTVGRQVCFHQCV